MPLPPSERIPAEVYEALNKKGWRTPYDMHRATGFPATTVHSMFKDCRNTALKKAYAMALLLHPPSKDPVGYIVDIFCDTSGNTKRESLRALMNRAGYPQLQDVEEALEWSPRTLSQMLGGRWSATTFSCYQTFCKLTGISLTRLCALLFDKPKN